MNFPRKRDDEDLMMMELRDYEGETCKEIGARFGMTKNAVIGRLNRIENEYAASEY